MDSLAPNYRDVVDARARIAPYIRDTPLVRSAWLSGEVGAEVYLKLECFQRTGSFKVRGAANRLLSLPRSSRIVAVSAGNHARAVAEIAGELGLPTTIVMPRSAAPTKVAAIAQYAVELLLEGESYDEAEAFALALADKRGATFVSPYNGRELIAGQGTVALDALDASGPTDAIYVPTGGGGLLAGTGIVAQKRGCAVIGAQPEVAATMAASFATGRQIDAPQGESMADGLTGNLEPSSMTVPIVLDTVDRFALVSESAIARSVRDLVEMEHILVEPSAAVGVAALRGEGPSARGKRVVVLVTGGNVGADHLARIIVGAQ